MTPARYVPGGGAAWADPWPGYAALRDHDPVHHVVPPGRAEHDYYVLTRHADVSRPPSTPPPSPRHRA